MDIIWTKPENDTSHIEPQGPPVPRPRSGGGGLATVVAICFVLLCAFLAGPTGAAIGLGVGVVGFLFMLLLAS